MTKSVIIDTSKYLAVNRVLSIIKTRQNGKCHFCGIDFVLGDIIIGCGHRRSYYHKRCARKTEYNLTFIQGENFTPWHNIFGYSRINEWHFFNSERSELSYAKNFGNHA